MEGPSRAEPLRLHAQLARMLERLERDARSRGRSQVRALLAQAREHCALSAAALALALEQPAEGDAATPGGGPAGVRAHR